MVFDSFYAGMAGPKKLGIRNEELEISVSPAATIIWKRKAL